MRSRDPGVSDFRLIEPLPSLLWSLYCRTMSSESEYDEPEEGGVGQWEPDEWAGSSSVEESEEEDEPQAGPSKRRGVCLAPEQ